MSEAGAKENRRKLWKYLAGTGIAAFVFLGVLAWYATTDSFQLMVRQRLANELERITGGRVELGSIHTIPFRFTVDVRDLTIHGKEAADQVPYAHVDRLIARVKLISVLGAEFGFDSLVAEHLVIHVITYPDGSTNQPEPKVRASQTSPAQRLFSTSIGHLEVRRGDLLFNDQKLPLDFSAEDISANLDYSLLRRHYDGDLLIGKIDSKWDGFRPISWMAEVHFQLGADNLNVKSLSATSGRTHLRASGHVEGFAHPQVSCDYELTLDLAEAGAVARRTELRRGVAHLTGRGSWAGPQFASQGTFQITDLEWRDPALTIPNGHLETRYSLDQQKLSLSAIGAKVLGGEISGDAEVVNWLSAPQGPKLTRTAAQEQKGTVHLKMKNLSAAEMAAAVASTARPLQHLNLAGLASGSIETRWRGAPRFAESQISVTVVPPEKVSPSQLPLNVRAEALYRSAAGELQVAQFMASTRATQVHASGTFSRQASIKLTVSTGDLSEWQPALNALGYQERLPFNLAGRASFTGTATGRLSEIDFVGKIQSQDFRLFIPRTGRPPAHIQCDWLTADVELSPQDVAAHNGVLRHDATYVNFDLNFGLDNRQFTGNSSFEANAQAHNADIAEILASVGHDYPLRGKANLFLHVSGTGAEPHGQGHVQLLQATLNDKPLQQADAAFSFTHDELSLVNIHLKQDEASVTGDGRYNSATAAFQLNLHGDNFDLSRIPNLQTERVSVQGALAFDAEGSGTLDQPVINAKVRLKGLTFNQELAGDLTMEAVTQGADLRLSGRSQFQNARLDIDGTVHLREQWPATLNLHFDHFDVDPILGSYLGKYVTGHSAVAGDLQLLGPLREPKNLRVSGNLSDFFADLGHIQARNNGPIRFTFANGKLNIQQLRLIGTGTDLAVGGTVQLSGERQIDLRAEGHADLSLIHNTNPDFTTSGSVAVDVSLGGTLDHTSAQGRLQVSHGYVQYSDLPSGLSDINGSLVFNQDRLQVENLTAHVGAGDVSIGGYATAYNRQLNFDLTLQGKDVRLRYPPGVSSMTDAQLRWAGTQSASSLSGTATITKLAVTPGFDFASYLQRAAQSSALPQTNPLLNRIHVDVHVLTTPELQMQTAVVRLSGDADLHVQGTMAKPVLLGRADIIEGEVYFSGAKYRMERGDITFTNPVTTTPVLDLQASTRVRDYDVTVNLNGQFDKLNLSYHSEPPLPTADIISLLALGQTQEESAQLQQSGQSPFAQQASSAVLAEALNTAISNRAQRLFGISHIKINPQGITSETTPTQATPLPAVTIEQQVRDNLTLTYTTNVSTTSQQIIQGEYNVTKDLSIVGIRDYNGVVSFEVRLRQRKK